ncbi:MAG: DEAD/DEAH box helicase [Candidatus Micrarchaeaceae archaeon]
MPDAYELFLKYVSGFTDIQKRAFPVIEAGKNCLIISPTGTGKTEAAFLPLLKRISSQSEGAGIALIYITPLRALNRDLFRRLREICDVLGVSIGVRHGDTTKKERAEQIRNPPRIIITTPETLQNMLVTKGFRSALRKLKFVVVDELHELYYNKRGAQLAVALERLVEISGEFQRIGLSATVAEPHKVAYFLSGGRPVEIVSADDEKSIELEVEMPEKPEKAYPELVKLFDLDSDALARIERIAKLIRESNAVLVFANTRYMAESLGSKLTYLNSIASFGGLGVHHSSIDKEERIRVEEAFKRGEIKGLIATSSLELGIDIGRVDLVVQYGSPRQVTRLLQRVGRSGHALGRVSRGRIIVASALEGAEAAAIAELAFENALEKMDMERGALDVLANQVCGIALEYGSIDLHRLYSIFLRSAPYAKLKMEELLSVLNFIAGAKLIRFDGKEVRTGSRTLRYFINNISVLPEISKFLVKNVSGNSVISSLDEKFVSSYIDEGTVFITKGLPWKVVSIDEGVVYVEPSTSFEAAIPDWEGEDIPVSYEVASRAFEILGEIASGDSRAKRILNAHAYEKVRDLAESQGRLMRFGSKNITVEEAANYAIVYAPLGKLANDFLAKLLGSFMESSSKGILIKSTPYGIIIDYGSALRQPDVKRAFETLIAYKAGEIRDGIAIMNSELFRYKFVQVAKLFGIVEKKATLSKGIVEGLIRLYRDTPLTEEVMRDIKKNYFDAERVEELLDRLRNGKANVEVFKSSGSALAHELISSAYHYRELVMPLLPSDEEVKQFEDGINKKTLSLVCTFCGFVFSVKLSELGEEEKILCPACKSPMVTVMDDKYLDLINRIAKGKKINAEGKKLHAEMLRGASLVDAYGKRALMALATYGIGIATAARLLKMVRKDRRLFMLDLINAKKEFLRNRKFWSERA